MSTSDLTVTLVGWVGTEPKHYTGASVTPFTSFRMANTRRYFDRALNTWTDGRTEWFTVKVWRQAALNVAASLRKGDPVLVHGRLATEHWDGPDGPRTSLVLEALAIGPDLTYGRASFARTVHVTGAAAGEPGDAGVGDPAAGPDGTGSDTGDSDTGDSDTGGSGAAGFMGEDPWASDADDVVTGPGSTDGCGADGDPAAAVPDPEVDPVLEPVR